MTDDVISNAKELRAAITTVNRQEAAARAAAMAQAAAERACGPSSSWDATAAPAAPAKPLSRKQRRRAKLAAKPMPSTVPDKIAQLVTPEARTHGRYALQDVPGPTIVTDGEEKLTISEVVMNRGGTAVDRWFLNDKAGLFEEPQQQAIRYCRSLWHRAGGLSAIDPTAERLDRTEGWSQQEAINELYDLKKRVPRRYWEVFENVCRFDEEAGTAGSSLASNRRSAVDAAKTCVAFTASLVAEWRRL